MLMTKPRHLPRLRDYDGVLICFGVGQILTAEELGRYERCYNFHGASRFYPGRDPHHWASYEGATSYGAVVHEMTERVDEGRIVGSLTVGCVPSCPSFYRELGERCMYALFDVFDPYTAAPTGEEWAGVKRRRADALKMDHPAFASFR